MRLRIGFSVCAQGETLYQSYGGRVYRPLGYDYTVFENLPRHQIDEVLIISPKNLLIDNIGYKLSRLKNKYIGIPVTIGGNISQKMVEELLEWGCVERVMFSGTLQNNSNRIIKYVESKYGRQAVVACLALRIDNFGNIYIRQQDNNSFNKLTKYHIEKAYDLCDEVIFQDLGSYGMDNGFHYERILDYVVEPSRTILNGGLSVNHIKAAKKEKFAAVYLDNLVMHSENRVK